MARSDSGPGRAPVGLASIDAACGCDHAVVLGGPLERGGDSFQDVSIPLEYPIDDMGKLVRDRIPEIIEAEGRTPMVRALDEQAFDGALFDKLLEEVAELRDAEPQHRLEEAADVYEVLLTILAGQGVGADDLAEVASEKRQTRGGFAQRWWWEAD